MPFHTTMPAYDARLATQADLENLASNIATQQSQRLSQFMTDTEVQARFRQRDAQIAQLMTRCDDLTSRVQRQGEVITALAVRIDALEARLGAATEHVVHPVEFRAPAPADLTTTEPAIGAAQPAGLVPQPAAGAIQRPVPADNEPAAVSGHVAPVPSNPTPEPVAPTPVPAPVVTITTEQLGTALRAMATRRSLDAVRALMAARGFPNASSVPQEARADLLAAINAA